MAIVFPVNPSVNDTFTVGSITYKWDSTKWIGLGVTPTDKLIEGSNSLEINANNDLVWTGNNVGIQNVSPDEALEVGAGTVDGGLKVSGQSSSVTSDGLTVDWESSSNSTRIFSEPSSGGSSAIRLFTTSSGTRSEALRITSDGMAEIFGSGPGGVLQLSSKDQTISAAGEVFGSITFKANDASTGQTGVFAKIDAASNRLFDGDNASGMDLRFYAGDKGDGVDTPPERLRIKSTGTVTVNNPTYNSNALVQTDAKDNTAYAPPTAYPANQIELQNSVSMGSAIMRFRSQSDNASAGIWNVGAVPRTASLKSDFVFQSRTADSTYSEIARFSGDGKLLLGTTGRASVVTDPAFQIEGVAANNASMSIIRNSAANPPYLQLAATGGTTLGSLTATPSSGFLGQIVFGGSNGTELRPGVYITCQNDTNTAWTSTSCPSKIVIGTTKANQTSPTTAFSIDSNGIVRSHQTGISGSSLTVDLGSNQVVAGFQAKETTGTAQALTGYWFNHGGLNAGIASTRQVTNQWGTDLRFYTHPFATNNQHKVYERLRIDPDGRIFIRDLLGNASSGSNVKYSNSDDELRYDTSSGLLKTNITECPYGIETVKKLKPSRYTPQEYDKEGNINVTDEVLIGFIAEEMVEEVPEVVQMYPKYTLTRNDEDTEIVPASISYDKLTAVLTKALQEAIVEIETLKGRLDAAGL